MVKKREGVLLAVPWCHHKLLKGVSDYMAGHGVHLDVGMALVSDGMPEYWRGEVVIGHYADKEKLKALYPWIGTKMVLIGRESDAEYHTVSDDHTGIAASAAAYLIGKGFRSFAGYRYENDGGPRLEYFAKHVRDAGHAYVELVGEGMGWSERHAGLCRRLKQLRAGTAVFAPNDQVAIEVLEACEDAGIEVPGDISVVGVRNDEAVCDALKVPLSSVDNNLYGVGQLVAKLAAGILKGKFGGVRHHAVQPRGVSERESSRIYKAELEDIELSRALSVIRSDYLELDFDCSCLAARCGMSLRKLYLVFERSHLRKPAEEIRYLRMEHAKELLVRRPDSPESLIYECGYQNVRSFYKAFRSHVGMSPNQYRKSVR
ncbi:substrate-binding domain-containing protein [Rubritalea tangerina]|uniref:Substrate-binding domain-containing protein n=1 Tax=Rubritalea tangerina TaxID=430798 RepID=A0ABW4Z726_9BACT